MGYIIGLGSFGVDTKEAESDDGRYSELGMMAEESDARKTRVDEVIDLIFRHFLGRGADQEGLVSYRQAILDGMRLEAFIDSVCDSDEAKARRAAGLANKPSYDLDIGIVIDLIYRAFLLRDADEGGKRYFTAAINNGMSIPDVIDAVSNAPEACEKRFSHVGADGADETQDAQFIRDIVSVLSECGVARPRDFDRCKPMLQEKPMNRMGVIQKLIAERSALQKARRNNPAEFWVMGTDRFLTREAWDTKVSELKLESRVATHPSQNLPLENRTFSHSGDYRVSAIASMYKGGKYIRNFLDNIVSQTIFDQCELIIVDACSPDGESDLIFEYMNIYPNIVYKRFDCRIGIYDAWNYAASIARGTYLTNTNLDDMRREDSFEIQADALDRNEFSDVVYQDFYYSLDSSLDFKTIAACGFKSNLPIATPNNMLEFNCPHNAPMWRKRLHDELGFFDVNYRSAGDYEFWLRCLKNRKAFFKVNAPHVVYFCNPEGVSTVAGTPGADEVNRARRQYAEDLMSPYFFMSREAFAGEVGLTSPPDVTVSDYDLVQKHMRSFSVRSRMKWPDSPSSARAV